MTAAGKVTSGWAPAAVPIPRPAPLLTGRKGFLYPELQFMLFIYFPLRPEATLDWAPCSPISSLQDGFHELERRRDGQTRCCTCLSVVMVRWPQETGTADLHPSPCPGSGNRETDTPFNSLWSAAPWMGCFSSPKAPLLLHFRTGSLAVSILLNEVPPEKRKTACAIIMRNRTEFQMKFTLIRYT